VDGSDDNSLELDFYGGFGGSITEQVSFDIGLIHYNYPGDDSADFEEVYAGVSFSLEPVSVDVYAWHDWENDNTYYELNLGVDVAENVSLSAHVGENDPDVGKNTTDYKLAVGTSFFGLDWEAAYADVEDSADDGVFFVTMSKEFSL
jgi:uncharacterized protein (TIGR02001 family)